MSTPSSYRSEKVKRGDGAIVQKHQAVHVANVNKILSIQASPGPSTSILVNGGLFHQRLKHRDIPGRIRSMTVRFDVQGDTSNQMLLTASPYFVERIEFWVGTRELFRVYDDQLFWEACSLVSDKRQNLKDLNVSNTYYQGTVQSKVAQTRSYRLPLVSNVWALNESFLRDLRDDEIDIRYYFRNGVVSSGSGVPALVDIYMEVLCEAQSSEDQKSELTLFNSPQALQFLDCVREQKTSQTLNKGTQFKMDLDGFQDLDVSHLLFCIRADSFSATSNGFLKTLALPPNSTVDILNSNNESIWGQGTPVKVDFLRNEILHHHLETRYGQNRSIYMIPFCHDVIKAYHGVRDGFLRFSNGYKLAITPSSDAGALGVHTINLTNTPVTATFYKMSVYNKACGITSITDDIDCATDPDSALNALPALVQNPKSPITLTANQAPSAGDFTLTYSASDCVEPDTLEIKAHWDSAATAAGGASTTYSTDSVTTDHVQSWTNASTYTIDVYALHHKTLMKLGGQLSSRDA